MNLRYVITNAQGRAGRAWTTTYPTREAAAEAVRRALGRHAVHLSGAFTTDTRANIWACYPSAAEEAHDVDGAYAPWIVEHVIIATAVAS